MNTKMTGWISTAMMLMMFVPSCSQEDLQTADPCADLPAGKLKQQCVDKKAGKADRIDANNAPQLFGVQMDYHIQDLPLNGKAEQMPWPETYWPNMEDSVNVRWQGSDVLSPLEKYDVAFNNWTPPEGFMDLKPFSGCGHEFDPDYYDQLGPAARFWTNTRYGNKAMRDVWDQPECADAIPSWVGLCHAWTAASIMEKEPGGPVTYNGVTFDVSDMKALLIMQYSQNVGRFIGLRCDKSNQALQRDDRNRIVQQECRDTNPGSLHIVLGNMLGRDKRAFAEDRKPFEQVWNQPVVGYDVKFQEEISEEQAAKLVDPECADNDGCAYHWNTDAERFFEVLTDVHYISESYPSTEPLVPEIEEYTHTDEYHYVLECDARGTIIGGEWISERVTAFPDRLSGLPNSGNLHTDFVWLPVSAGAYAPNPEVYLSKVQMLVEMSQKPDEPAPAEPRVFQSMQAVAIPDFAPEGVVSAIQVADEFNVAEVQVNVHITHDYVGDLTLVLRHGDSTYELQRNAGGPTQNLVKTFDAAGFSGTAAGTWELQVIDGAEGNTGTIDSWELTLTEGEGSPTEGEVFSSRASKEIPDNDPAGLSDVIEIPGPGVVRSLKVTLDISHPWVSDLKVSLAHGTGVSVLHNREGDDSDNIQRTYVVREFNNASAEGPWTLSIVDTAQSDQGKLNGWSIEIVR